MINCWWKRKKRKIFLCITYALILFNSYVSNNKCVSMKVNLDWNGVTFDSIFVFFFGLLAEC